MPFVLDASAVLEAAFDDESGAVGKAVVKDFHAVIAFPYCFGFGMLEQKITGCFKIRI